MTHFKQLCDGRLTLSRRRSKDLGRAAQGDPELVLEEDVLGPAPFGGRVRARIVRMASLPWARPAGPGAHRVVGRHTVNP